MREFSDTDLQVNLKAVTAEADQSPVAISMAGQPKYVLMTIELYKRIQRNDPREVHRTRDAPPEITAEVVTAIDDFLGEDSKGEAGDEIA